MSQLLRVFDKIRLSTEDTQAWLAREVPVSQVNQHPLDPAHSKLIIVVTQTLKSNSPQKGI